ncbi:MAG: hypothetical protein CMJ89_03640 [Planctomycetes bacterium]|jgi:imidazolonepropionase-like amidohydrolase|nr:hypothetical protein [Planctomycetota bacterium]
MLANLSLYLTVLAPTGLLAYTPQTAGDLVVVRAERLILTPGNELAPGVVLIEDGRIVGVGGDLATPEGARELSGKVACAGFIDPWSSLGLDPQSVRDNATNPAVRTADAVDPWHAPHLRLEALRGGVTSARVQAGISAPLGGIGVLLGLSEADSPILLEDACVSATLGVSRPRKVDIFDRISEVDRLVGLIEKGRAYRESQVEYNHEIEEWEKNVAEKEKELEEDFKKAKKKREKDLEKAEEKGSEFKEKRYREDKKPKRPKFDVVSEILARVAHGELTLVVEVHRSAELRRLLTNTADFDRLRLVIVGATEALDHVDALAERRIPTIVWPAPIGDVRRDEYSEHDLSLAGELERAGVLVLLGGGGGPHARELRMLAALAVSQGLDRDGALAAITTRPARAFDVAGRVGALKSGMDADVLVFDGDPLDTTSKLLYCLSKGEVVVE